VPTTPPPTEKSGLHPRNPHRFRYDFKELIKSCPKLAPFVSLNKYKSESIDFSNPEAVKILNLALLRHFYQLSYWDIPENYLCPPIPGRADYIHYIADLLASCNENKIPE
jgi:23S rRNA (adenine1618-N6)-methyltransferase